MGYGQFMLFLFIKYVVDFDGDGYIDLWNLCDVIGSVVNYFKQYGWVSGDCVVVFVSGWVFLLEDGFKMLYLLDVFVFVGLCLQGLFGGYW